jgi:hypothetical protein
MVMLMIVVETLVPELQIIFLGFDELYEVVLVVLMVLVAIFQFLILLYEQV